MFEPGIPVTGKMFFDRKKAKNRLKLLLKDKLNLMIKAPRRYGKTSLIKELLGNEEYIYADLMNRTSSENIANEILNELYRIVGVKGYINKVTNNIKELFEEKNLKGNIGYGDLALGFEIVTGKTKEPCDKLIEAIKTVNELGAKTGKKITIVLDEFQEITKLECGYDVLGALRATLQHQQFTNTIFLGSVETIMNKIFSDKKSPFYNYCTQFELEPFDIKELKTDLLKMFREKSIVFEDEKGFGQFLEKLGGHPANTMLVMQKLYYNMLEKEDVRLVKSKDLTEAFNEAYYSRKEESIQMLLRAKTKKHYHHILFCMANGYELEIDSATAYKARRGLLEMGILIQRGRDTYHIVDNFLEEYLRENHDE